MTLVVLSFLVPVGIVLGLFFAQWGIPWEPPAGMMPVRADRAGG